MNDSPLPLILHPFASSSLSSSSLSSAPSRVSTGRLWRSYLRYFPSLAPNSQADLHVRSRFSVSDSPAYVYVSLYSTAGTGNSAAAGGVSMNRDCSLARAGDIVTLTLYASTEGLCTAVDAANSSYYSIHLSPDKRDVIDARATCMSSDCNVTTCLFYFSLSTYTPAPASSPPSLSTSGVEPTCFSLIDGVRSVSFALFQPVNMSGGGGGAGGGGSSGGGGSGGLQTSNHSAMIAQARNKSAFLSFFGGPHPSTSFLSSSSSPPSSSLSSSSSASLSSLSSSASPCYSSMHSAIPSSHLVLTRYTVTVDACSLPLTIDYWPRTQLLVTRRNLGEPDAASGNGRGGGAQCKLCPGGSYARCSVTQLSSVKNVYEVLLDCPFSPLSNASACQATAGVPMSCNTNVTLSESTCFYDVNKTNDFFEITPPTPTCIPLPEPSTPPMSTASIIAISLVCSLLFLLILCFVLTMKLIQIAVTSYAHCDHNLIN